MRLITRGLVAHACRPVLCCRHLALVIHALSIAMHPFLTRMLFALMITSFLPVFFSTADAQERMRPEETEVWEPVPPVVTPGEYVGPVPPPSDAIVLFDGTNLDEWASTRTRGDAGWRLHDGVMSVVQEAGGIHTRRHFKDYQLHLEWRVPQGVIGSGQSRGNSGLFMAWDLDRGNGYELQILDSYENETYVNGMAGATYKQSIPQVNPMRPPGSWQTYDVVWRAPRFDDEGNLTQPARVTAFFNGILIQDSVDMEGETYYIGKPEYHPFVGAPIHLQAHGDPGPTLSFRNIWIRPLD